MKLILIRHGATAANEKRLYCGWSDIPLSEKGRESALLHRKAGGYPDVSGFAVLTSGMKRAEESLELIFGSVPHGADGRFREMNFGAFEMKSYEELKNTPEYICWITAPDFENAECPGGESSAAFKSRVISALRELSSDTLLICHGGVISAIMEALFPDEGKNLYEWQPSGYEGYQVVFENMRGLGYTRIPAL